MLYIDEDYNYKMGIELFDKEKYALAQDYFEKVIDYYGSEHTDVKADAEYFSALCSIELFNNDAEYRIANFIADYPESPLTRVAYFEMGKHQYRNKEYKQTIFYFNKVWKQNLSKEQLNEFYFKFGYAYFKEKKLEKASKMFYEVLNKETKYKSPAQYYYSHLMYTEGNYETALKGFNQLCEDPTFSPIVPYYIIQIYYLQGKSDKVLETGPELLNATKSKREAEISRLVGEALYKGENYVEALPYLEKYKEKSDIYTREDIYQLGYVYYLTGDYDNSVNTLSNITNVEDELTQNAFFHIADSYLKLGQKDQARMAFSEASRLNFDGEIKEAAMLNYAKLSYELSYSPFNETITAFYNYLTSYPNSIHRDEAYGYLAKVYLTSKNYREALASLNKIQVKSPEMMAAYQKVAFYRGLELFNNLQFEAALAAFEFSLNEKAMNKQMHSLTLYWKAEALYRIDDYENATNNYNSFLHSPGAYLLEEYNKTYYNLGYTNFKQKQYTQAISWFRKYIDKGNEVEKIKRVDAFIRIGDCYFVNSKYVEALEYYGNAVELDTFDVDYALFQKGFSFGLLKQYNEKIISLTQLLDKNPESTYAADAIFERGRSFVAIDSINYAINDFDKLVVEFPNSSYVSKALLQLGLLYYSGNNNEKALTAYKQVVDDYSGTSEANDALLGMKNIYVDLNRVDEYFTYAKEIGGAGSVSNTEKDSLTYLSAERVYMSANWALASQMLSNYLANFKNGKFATNAHYYRGDAYLRTNKEDSALNDFTYVVEKAKNIFTEQSLLNAAELEFKQADYTKAYKLYKQLENQAEIKSNLLIARNGQMQSAFKDSNYTKAIEAAQRVLITEKVQEEDIRAVRLVMAKSYEATNILDLSVIQYRLLAQDIKNIEGAESKYKVCQLLMKQDKPDETEKEILDFIETGTPHQYWLAKTFIILSDIYVLKGDGFQAKAYLKSIFDNYEILDDGIIKEAEVKYDQIVTEENRKFKREQQAKENDGMPVEYKLDDSEKTE